MGITLQTAEKGMLEEEVILNFNGPEDDEDDSFDDDFDLDEIEISGDLADFDDDDF